jgi:hypothetical protein
VQDKFVGCIAAVQIGSGVQLCKTQFYHQLRSTIAQVGGKKELTGRTDIRNRDQQPVRAADRQRDHLLQLCYPSRLLTKYEASGNARALAQIMQMSPAAWRHILLNGHYTFQSDGKMIDLDALVAGLKLE